jgi:hypothetical protein
MTAHELAQESAHAREALSMGGAPRPRTTPDGSPKMSPHGKPTFSAPLVMAREDGGLDRGVTIAVCEPSEFPLGSKVRLDGRVWLTPYVQENNGRSGIGQSIVCDRVVLVTLTAKSAARSDV